MNLEKNGTNSLMHMMNLISILMKTRKFTGYLINQLLEQLSENSWIRRSGSVSLTQLMILKWSKRKIMTTICGYPQCLTISMHLTRNMLEAKPSWECAGLEDEKMANLGVI